MIFGLGPWELGLLLLLAITLSGWSRMPRVLRELGRAHGLWQRVKHDFRHLFRWF